MRIEVQPHPLLSVAAFTTDFPQPLGELRTPETVVAFLRPDAPAPVKSTDALRAAIRDLLRYGGYKPTGRGKPAAEYLLRAAAEGTLGSINLAVDACNATSLHSGFPISVVDLEDAFEPFLIEIAQPGTRYVFNQSGQEIELAGLLSLFDGIGACANAVKDSQRTKTGPKTVRTLSVIWGCRGYESELAAAETWYRELLHSADARTVPAELVEVGRV